MAGSQRGAIVSAKGNMRYYFRWSSAIVCLASAAKGSRYFRRECTIEGFESLGFFVRPRV